MATWLIILLIVLVVVVFVAHLVLVTKYGALDSVDDDIDFDWWDD